MTLTSNILFLLHFVENFSVFSFYAQHLYIMITLLIISANTNKKSHYANSLYAPPHPYDLFYTFFFFFFFRMRSIGDRSYIYVGWKEYFLIILTCVFLGNTYSRGNG